MNHALIAPWSASLPSIDASAAARARVLFCQPLARALAQWVPGLTLAPAVPAQPAVLGKPQGGAAAAVEETRTRFGVVLRGRCAEVRLLLPASLDAVSAAILAAGAWSPQVQLSCLHVRAKAALGELLQGLQQLGLQPVQLELQPESWDVLDSDTPFECRWGEHCIEGRLRSPDLGAVQRLEAAVTRLRPASWAPASGLMLPLRAQQGVRRMALRTLRSLELGDVFLLDRRPPSAGRGDAGFLLVGGLRGQGAVKRACRLDGPVITILGERWMSTDTLTPLAPSATDADADVEVAGPEGRGASDALAHIEVDVHLELHVLSTPLAELAAMRPGYVLELPVPAAQASVSLVVGGQVIGRAEMVSVGDRLGARILELFNDAD